MLHTKRYEWAWGHNQLANAKVYSNLHRSDANLLNGHGQLTLLKDRDHIAGDPPPNAAVPEARRIILFRMPELKAVRDGWSNSQGSITFTYLDATVTYMAYSPGFYIGNSRFDAVCTDNLVPELMV